MRCEPIVCEFQRSPVNIVEWEKRYWPGCEHSTTSGQDYSLMIKSLLVWYDRWICSNNIGDEKFIEY